jgi:hypothetical protein
LNLILVLALLQSPEPTIDDRIAAFVKGDATARAELEKLGVYAIRPLQKARDRAPEKIDAFVLELKRSALPGSEEVFAFLDVHANVPGARAAFDDLGRLKGDFSLHLRFPVVFLPVAAGDLKSKEAAMTIEDRPLREALDQFCAQTGLDYAVFNRALVVGPPDRLWPSGLPPRTNPLTDAELARARTLAEALGAEAIVERDAAMVELKRLGVGAVEILETRLAKAEAEVAHRCRALIRDLKAPPPLPLGPPLAARQKLARADLAILDRLRQERLAKFRLNGVPMPSAANLALGSAPIRIRFPDRAATFVIPHLNGTGLTRLELLTLVAWAARCDFAIANGEIVFDAPEALGKAYDTGP